MTGLLARASPTQVRQLPESELPALCAELRDAIVEVCGQVGGHLGASLGAVELIVALHRVYKSPTDRIVFDVGHQAYAHKLLTGRAERMATLRQADGIAPFLDPRESEHDAFAAGHACTAVSVALGMLEAKQRLGRPGSVVAVVGDGALTGGLTFEGINNAGGSGLPLAVVLNDNQMSISANVGAISTLLRTPSARSFFEALGFSYLGPLDGHDLGALIAAFREARRANRPMLIHVVTQKGRGFAAAEADERTRGHAMGPYEWRDGKLVRSRGGKRTFSEAFADALEVAMARDPRVVAVTPAMVEGSAWTRLQARFPERVYDVGIAEQHAVTFSAGLAAQGMRPVCALYSTFLQRAYDQIVHDVCLPGLPVVFAVDRAGLVGADGATHQGAYDLAILRPLPGLDLTAPVFGEDVAPMLEAALARGGPTAIRFPRGTLPEMPKDVSASPVAGARWLQRDPEAELSIVTLGPLGMAARAAALGSRWNVLDARWLHPLDDGALAEVARSGSILVVEEGTTRGGLGSAVLEWLAARRLTVQVRLLGLPDAFVRHGDARVQRAALGLDAGGIQKVARELAAHGG